MTTNIRGISSSEFLTLTCGLFEAWSLTAGPLVQHFIWAGIPCTSPAIPSKFIEVEK